MEKQFIDINVDVGEGVGNEALIMPFISSCNIACGGHAGDIKTMLNVVKLAKANGVKIGAHPSFPDKENFGRVKMDMSYASLFTSLSQQIRALQNVLNKGQATLHHIKLHGALYNLAAVDFNIANVVIEVIKSLTLSIKLYAPYKSVLANVAIKNNLAITFEAFADRNYNDDLTLVSRQDKNALIDDPNIMFKHVCNMIFKQRVKTINNVEREILAETFCVHGDNPNAVNLIKALKNRIELNGIKIR